MREKKRERETVSRQLKSDGSLTPEGRHTEQGILEGQHYTVKAG